MSDQQQDIATVENEPKSLTNICYDCLERIFDFLDLESLMNVAGTCKRLQIAAAAKYADDFGNIRVVLLYDRGCNGSIENLHNARVPSIKVYGLKFGLTFLRCFGAKILNLRVSAMWVTRNSHRYVGQYINQYCASTLISIHFAQERSFSSEIFIKPFKAVKKLEFFNSNLGDQLPNFVNWFPNLNHLTFFCCGTLIDANAIAVSFPHLEHLKISVHEISGCITTESANKFLRANQQLKSIEAHFETSKFDDLLNMISTNKSTLKLTLIGVFPDMSDVQLKRLANEHPLLEELEFDGFEVNDSVALIRQLNSLKRIEFRVKDQSECDRFVSQLDSKWKHYIEPVLWTIRIISKN